MFEPGEMRGCAQEAVNIFSRGYGTKRRVRAAPMAVNIVVSQVPASHSRLLFSEPVNLPSKRLDFRSFMLDFRPERLRDDSGQNGSDEFVPLKARR
jgi:hypothetical protein